MPDRRLNVQTETRAVNTTKATLREDVQPPSASTVQSSSIVAERRLSPVFFRRLSLSTSTNRRKSSTLLPSTVPRPNTYRMEPEQEYRFRPYKIQDRILEVLAEQMKDQSYNSSTVNELIRDISRHVHHLVKHVQLPRYKLIIQTVIGQKLEQLLLVTSRCLWDVKTDNMLTVNYETKDMVAIVTVHAVYFD